MIGAGQRRFASFFHEASSGMNRHVIVPSSLKNLQLPRQLFEVTP